MAEIINGVPIGDLPGIESVPDDSMLVVEFLGKAYHMPGAVLRQMIQDVLDSMGDSVDDVTEARLTTVIETVLASGKYNGVSPSVEVLDEEDGTTVIHIIDAFGDKRYPVEVKGARNAVQYVEQELTDEQKAQARKNIGVGDGAGTADAVQYVPQTLTTEQQTQARNNIGISDYVSGIGILLSPNPDFTSQHVIMDWYMNGSDDGFGRFTFDVPYSAYELAQKQGYIKDETTFYKEMSSNLGNPKADSLQIDSDTGTLMLLSAGEPIGEAVTLPTGSADDSKIFIADLNTSTYEDIKAADDAGKICYALWGGYTACMLTTLSPESAIFTTLLDPHLGLYVKFTKGTVGVSDFGLTESHSVLYEPQSLTDAQKAQARENIGALSADDIDVDSIGSNVFVGNYDTVTFAEIKAAHDAGKVCFLNLDGLMLPLLYLSDTEAFFVREVNDTTDYKVTITSADKKDLTLVDKNTPIYVAQSLSDAQKVQARSNIGAAAAADIAATKYASTSTANTSYFKISDFGSWGTGAWYQKGFSMLITSRAGETVWFSLSANDSATTARAFRLMNTYSKIAGVYYSVSENAVYVKAAGWCNNVTAHILSNIGGDYVPTVASVSGLASDVVEVNIIEFGPASSGLAVGGSSTPLLLGGSATRPTYNGADMALSSDLSSCLPLGGGTITGALSINDKLTQGSPSGDASVASMNRFHSDLFVQGNGTAPNTPTVAGFYLGKSTSDENRHMDIVSGGEYSYIDFNKAGRGADFDARLLVNVASGWTDFMWGSHGDITQRVFNVNGSLRQSGTEVLTWGNAGTDSILPVRLRTYQDHNNAVSDPNLATETGFYYVDTATNRPPFSQSTNVDYRVLTTAYSDQWLQQIATDFRCGDMFLRRRENGTWTPWVRFATAGDLSGYLPLGGGLMTGSLKFQDSSLPQKSLEFVCGIDAFANGGEMGWQSKAEFLSGYALKSDIPTNYAKLKTYNDFVHDGNEITMVPAGYNHGGLYFNYRTASGQYDGNINNYLFCNGKGSTAGVTLTADSFSGTAARATADGNGRNIVSTYATKDEVVTAANGALKVTLSGTSVDKTLAQIETALNAGRHVYMAENDGPVYQLSMHMAGMMACFTSVVATSNTQVTVNTVVVYDGIEPSVFTKTL